MAEYKGIKGFKVQSLDADPVPSVAGWSAGGNFPGSFGQMASAGTQTATLSAGYFIPGPNDGSTASFTYDGTSWSPAPSMGTLRHQVHNNMTGTQTAAVIACGRNVPSGTFGLQATEEFSGSSWTSSGNYPIELRDANLFGIQTAAIAAGGNSSNPSVATNVNNSYNGSTWTATGNNNTTGRLSSCSFGTQTAGLLIGGYINSPTPNTYFSNTEEYDGSTWTTGGAYPVAISSLSGGGSQTAGIAFAGGNDSGNPTATNTYDGATWTAANSMTTGRNNAGMAKAGTSLSNIVFGGYTGTAYTNATEEYVDYSPYTGQTVQNIGQVWYNTTTKALKYTDLAAGTWASGGPLNTARQELGGAGTQTAALGFGGNPGVSPYNVTATEEYNGATWANNPTGLNTARRGLRGTGTQTAGLAFGGYVDATTSNVTATEEYDGSTWTSNPTGLNTARRFLAGAGTQTAALAFGGITTTPTGATEEYDGSTWTTSPGSLNTIRVTLSGTGTQTAALAFGGIAPGPSITGATEEYNGTSWATSPGSMNTARYGAAGAGTQTAALAAGGLVPPITAATEEYNGATWSTSPASLTTARFSFPGAGTQTLAVVFGGELPTGNTTGATEEWNHTATAIKTVTVS